MTLDEMRSELEQDMKINLLSIQAESADNPKIYGKWIRYSADIKRQLIVANNDLTKITAERFRYYTGRSEDDVCVDLYDKSELKFVMPADAKIIAANTKVALLEIMYDFCKQAIDSTKQRGYSIKSIIDVRMLEAGK